MSENELQRHMVDGRDLKPIVLKDIQVLAHGDVMDLKEMVEDNSSFAITDFINGTDQASYTRFLGAYMRYSELCDKPHLNKVPWGFTSLELSENSLGNRISPPEFIENSSLVHLICEDGSKRPRVNKYWLHFTSGMFIDFHLELSGSGIWHHVHQGEEVLYLLPLSTEVKDQYKTWITNKRTTNLLEYLPRETPIYKITVQEGETIIVPGGYLRASYTPVKSVVIGGNFLTFGNATMILQCHKLEEEINEKEIFRFPDLQKWMRRAREWILAKQGENHPLNQWETAFLEAAEEETGFFQDSEPT